MRVIDVDLLSTELINKKYNIKNSIQQGTYPRANYKPAVYIHNESPMAEIVRKLEERVAHEFRTEISDIVDYIIAELISSINISSVYQHERKCLLCDPLPGDDVQNEMLKRLEGINKI